MFRLLFGFVLGVIASYYAMPYLFKISGPLPSFSIESLLSSDQQLTSNTINATPPSSLRRASPSDTLSERVKIARSLARLQPPKAPASMDVTEVVFSIARQEPYIHTLLQERLPGGLTNEEAIAILSVVGSRG